MKKEHRGQKLNTELKTSGSSETLMQLPQGICYLCLPKKTGTISGSATKQPTSSDTKVLKLKGGMLLTSAKMLEKQLDKQ